MDYLAPPDHAAALRHVDDAGALARLPHAARTATLARLGWCLRIDAAPHRSKGGVVVAAAVALGVSPGAVHRYLADYRAEGWRGLVDGRHRGAGARGLPVRFQEHVRSLYDVHSRDDDGAEVHRTLVAQWQLWSATADPRHAIPGYELPPAAEPRTRLPYGWSLENIRRLRPTNYERSRSKRGQKEASTHLPHVLTTRVGSAFLARVCFDDQQYDEMIADGVLALSGITEASRPVGFNAIDFATAFHFPHHLRLLYKDTDEDRKKTLTSREFTWVVVNLLLSEGYRGDEHGTELIFEHATASGWRNKELTTIGGLHSFDDAVRAATGGKVFVNRSGKFNSPVFADMYFRPRSTGNFCFKTWIESAFRLVRTTMQALPGPTGRHFELAPEELHGIQRREKQLLAAIATTLSPRHASLLQHQLLSFQEFAEVTAAVYRSINARTDHALEGWREQGHTRQVWRATPTSEIWFERDELPADEIERTMILRRLSSAPAELTRELRLSPEQAAGMGRRDPAIRRFSHEMVPLVIPREWAVLATVTKHHCIELPNPLWPEVREQYVARLKTRTGHETLMAGTRLLAYPNPINPDQVAVCHPDGAYLGTLSRTVRAASHDTAAKVLQLHTRAEVERDLSVPLRARLAGIAEERTERERSNQRVLDGRPSLPEEIAEARREAGLKGAKTAAQSRLGEHADGVDWDAAPDPSADLPGVPDPFADLPDDRAFPESLTL